MRVRVVIEGMLAVHAKRAVFTALAGVPGVLRADVEVGGAVVDADDSLDTAQLRAAIEGLGLRVAGITRELPVV